MKYLMKKDNSTFIAILITYIIIILLIILYFSFLKNYISIPSCPIYTHLGIFCPACGGTRALISILNFDIISSIYFNPIVIYTLVFSTLYLITESINIAFKKNINIHAKLILKIGIFILFANWIIKNIISLITINHL